jgi:hypothetical protein
LRPKAEWQPLAGGGPEAEGPLSSEKAEKQMQPAVRAITTSKTKLH